MALINDLQTAIVAKTRQLLMSNAIARHLNNFQISSQIKKTQALIFKVKVERTFKKWLD